MLNQKMLAVIEDVNSNVAEREELVHCIAIALLTRKNLFVIGETGQAKSYAVRLFQERLIGARRFDILMSKQMDEDKLFGRIDLTSMIPGSMPRELLQKDPLYRQTCLELEDAYRAYGAGNEGAKERIRVLKEELDTLEAALYKIKGSTPRIVSSGKIPDADIVFLDEIFKAGEGVLNSLLTALNERLYNNEGEVVALPTISFFSASNEIPNFADPAESNLRPLYDRFELKVQTAYVSDRGNRLAILRQKQATTSGKVHMAITLEELRQMQQEVAAVNIPDPIHELMDDIMLALREAGVAVSDRKYFGYGPIVQAAAYLRGSMQVEASDLLSLKNYLWNIPGEEIETVSHVLEEFCANPVYQKIENALTRAHEAYADYINAGVFTVGQVRRTADALLSELNALDRIRTEDMTDEALAKWEDAERQLEELNRDVYAHSAEMQAAIVPLRSLQGFVSPNQQTA